MKQQERICERRDLATPLIAALRGMNLLCHHLTAKAVVMDILSAMQAGFAIHALCEIMTEGQIIFAKSNTPPPKNLTSEKATETRLDKKNAQERTCRT